MAARGRAHADAIDGRSDDARRLTPLGAARRPARATYWMLHRGHLAASTAALAPENLRFERLRRSQTSWRRRADRRRDHAGTARVRKGRTASTTTRRSVPARLETRSARALSSPPAELDPAKVDARPLTLFPLARFGTRDAIVDALPRGTAPRRRPRGPSGLDDGSTRREALLFCLAAFRPSAAYKRTGARGARGLLLSSRSSSSVAAGSAAGPRARRHRTAPLAGGARGRQRRGAPRRLRRRRRSLLLGLGAGAAAAARRGRTPPRRARAGSSTRTPRPSVLGCALRKAARSSAG